MMKLVLAALIVLEHEKMLNSSKQQAKSFKALDRVSEIKTTISNFL